MLPLVSFVDGLVIVVVDLLGFCLLPLPSVQFNCFLGFCWLHTLASLCIYMCEYDGTGCRLTIFRIAPKGGVGAKENPVEISRRRAIELERKAGLSATIFCF